MELLGKILLATDFSKSSDNIVNNALDLAKTFNSNITLIHVLPDDIKNEKARTLLNKTVVSHLEATREKIENAGVTTDEPVMAHGNQFDQIIHTADNINANIIMIGAGEKSKDDAFQLGTTAEKIIRKSNKAVLVVKQDNPLDAKKIFCPVDCSDESGRALKNAITLARRFAAELIIFSVVDIKYADSQKGIIDCDEEIKHASSEHTKEYKEFLKKFNLKDLNWKEEIPHGDPATEILKAIGKYKPGLLVMGTSGKSGIGRFLMGSVTEKVIREVPCTFITMKSEDIINLQLKTRIRDIESHYNNAKQLMKDGFYDESINQFKICLNINDMHVPALNGIAEVYKKTGDIKNADKYSGIAKEVLARMWDKKIEAEIRQHYKV